MVTESGGEGIMSEKTKWLEKYAPLGIHLTSEIGLYIFGMIAATLHSMWFLLEYGSAVNNLYQYSAGKRVLMEGARIQGFSQLTEGVFLTGQLVCIVTLLVVIYHYLYHYQGSRMMYLMNRLPDKMDVHKRCWTLPVAGSCIAAVWMMLLKMIYYAIYLLCTPSQCLPL